MRRILLLSLLLLSLLAVTAFAGDRFRYVYSYGPDSQVVALTHGSLEDVVRLQKRFSGVYLWASLDGRDYLIRDAALLDELRRAHAPIEALTPGMKALQNKMRPLERRQERLEDEYDKLSDADDDDLTAAERDRMRQLRGQLRDIERELRGYEQEEQRLDRREEELDVVFDDAVEQIVRRAIRNGLAKRLP